MGLSYNIASISDIHLGNRRTDAEYIIDNLDKYLTNRNTLEDIDILFLVGDVFDTQLMLSSTDIPFIQAWIGKLLVLCAKHNVILRILEGTPSHDRAQSEQFNSINNIILSSSNHFADMRYVDTLSIEHIDKYNIDVLYLPDEWNSSNEQTQLEVAELLEAKGLSQVDYVVMHGTFEHQLPPHVKSPKHNNQYYESITKKLIFVGHIHIHSIQGKIVAQGSFDRLSHNDEVDKGYVKVNVFEDDHYCINFIKNENAKIYKTIVSVNEDNETLINRLIKVVDGLPEESYIRIQCMKNDDVANIISIVKKRWPLYIWSVTFISEDEDQITMVNDKPTYKPLIINQQNIRGLMIDRLLLRGNDKDILQYSNEILDEVL